MSRTNSVDVSWAPADGNGSEVTAYLVTAVVGGVNGVATATPATSNTARLSGLAGGASTRVAVRALSACGPGPVRLSAAVTPSGAATTYATTVIAAKPSAYYRLGDTPGSPVGADSSGGVASAMFAGADLGVAPGALAPSDQDTAVNSNGACCVATYATPVLPTFNQPRTVEVWVRPTDGSQRWVAGWGRSGTDNAFDVGVQDNRVVVDFWNDSASFATDRTLVDGAWHQVSVTYDGTRVTAYVDGVVIGGRTLAGGLNTVNDSGLVVGGYHNGGGNFYGDIDELAIYPRALDTATVAGHFAASNRARPVAPANVSVAAGGDNQAVVTWTVPPASAPAVNEYVVTAVENGARSLSTVVSGARTAARVTGLAGGHRYTFVVAGRNTAGTGTASSSPPLLVAGTVVPYASVVSAGRPAVYYRLGESGVVVGGDSSGNGALLTYSRPPTRTDGAVVGDVDTAVTNDGSCCVGYGYGSLPEFDDARTVEFWARPVDDRTEWAAGWGTRDTDMGFLVGLQSSGVRVDAWGDALAFPTPRRLADGRWHHVVVTYDGTTAAAYLDGAALGSHPFAGPLDTVNDSDLYIGAGYDGSSAFYGDLDDIAIYGHALDATEVRAHFVAGGHTAPVAPTGVAATAGANSVTATWAAPGETLDPITSYIVSARRGGKVVGSVAAPADATGARLSGLPGGSAVVVDVVPANSYGAGAATTSAPVTPTGPSATYASTILAAAPSVYYRLGEAAGTPSTASDDGVSPPLDARGDLFGTDGALRGDPDTAASNDGGCCLASGAAVLPRFDSARSVEAWVRPLDGSQRWIVGWGSSDTDSSFDVGIQGSQLLVDTYNEGLAFQNPRSLVDGNWHHVVVTYDGTRLAGYVDGNPLGTGTLSGPIDTTEDTGINVGAYSNGGGPFYGGVDELAVYPTALTAAAVRSHFDASGHAVPAAAGNAAATASANAATVTWTAAQSPDPVTGYLVTAYSGGVARNAKAVLGNATSAVVTGLAGGVPYTFRVVARDVYGDGPAATAAPITPTGVPNPYATTVIADAPQAYYRLGDAVGSVVGADSSGRGHPLAYDRVTAGVTGSIVGDADRAVTADGECCVATAISDLPAQNAARTLEVWAQPNDATQRWIAGWGTNSTRRSFNVGLAGDRLLVDTYADGLSFPIGRSLVDGAWHHIAVSYDGSLVVGYVDGVEVGRGTLGGALHTAAKAMLYVGALAGGGAPFYGGIDDLAVYRSALSATKIAAHFAASGHSTPTAVTGLTAANRVNSVSVKWTALPRTLGVTQYTVTALVAGVARNALIVPGTATTAVLTGLPGGVAVSVRVVATNAYGTGAAATSSSATPSGASVTYASSVLAQAPVAYYRLGESSSVSLAADSSGRAAPAAVQRGSWGAAGAIAGDADTSVTGDGGCCIATAVTPSPKFNSARSVSVWVRPSDANLRYVVGWGTYQPSKMFDVGVQDDQVVVVTYGDDLYFPAGRSLVDGAWHHIVVTYDGSVATGYVDGVGIGSQAFRSRLNTVTDGSLVIGAGVGGDRPWYGDLDELAVFSTALSAAQVATQFAAAGHAAPPAPTSATATAGTNTVSVSWAATSRTVDPTTDFLLVARRAGTVVAAKSAPSTARTAVLSGIAAGPGVTVDVYAANAYGAGPARTSSAVAPTGSATTYASSVLGSAPVAYYRLGETPGSAVGADSARGNRSITYSRATLGTSGPLTADTDTAASGDGGCCMATARVVGLPRYDGARSAEMWVRPGDGSFRWAMGWGAQGQDQEFAVGVDGSDVAVGTYGHELDFASSIPLADGAWHHVAVTFDGTTVRAYVDGVAQGSQTPDFALDTVVGNVLQIGAASDGGAPFYGDLDEVAVYPTALPASTIAAHYAAR